LLTMRKCKCRMLQMNMTCFIAAAPCRQLSMHGRRAACPRRSQLPRCCSAPVGPGDNAWLDMARSLASNPDEADPIRTPPKWAYPDGDNFSIPEEYPDDDDRLDRPWDTWNAALERDKAVEEQGTPMRDPSAETEFWRDSARDVVESIGIKPADGVPATSDSSRSWRPDIAANVPSDPRELWGAASNVTGAVADLQTQLWDEIQNINLNDDNSEYRDFARELASRDAGKNASGDSGPDASSSPETSAISAGNRDGTYAATDRAATAGSGWNPDVDWRRFDDVAREAEKERASTARNNARVNAEQTRSDGSEKWSQQSSASEDSMSVTYTDQDGKVLSSAEVEAAIAEGAIFVDENGNDLADEAPGVGVLGSGDDSSPVAEALSNSSGLRSSTKPVIGEPSSSLAPADYTSVSDVPSISPTTNLQRRNSQSDRDIWRDAAREVSPQTQQNEPVSTFDEASPSISERTTGNESGVLEDNSARTSISGDEGGLRSQSDDGRDGTNIILDSRTPDDVKQDEADISNAWSRWNSGREVWSKAVESAPERDAKAEVDMWRGAAKSVVSGLEAKFERQYDSEVESGPAVPTSESNPWSAWNKANSSWEQSLTSTSNKEVVNEADRWRDAARVWSSDVDSKSNEHSSSSPPGNSSSDWGASMSPEAMRPGSSWSSWQGSEGSGPGTGRSTWWDSRQDVARKTKSVSSPSDSASDPSTWRSVARDLRTEDSVSDDEQSSSYGTAAP
jgi:hypothetical protein